MSPILISVHFKSYFKISYYFRKKKAIHGQIMQKSAIKSSKYSMENLENKLKCKSKDYIQQIVIF